jgi:hypothetical protein
VSISVALDELRAAIADTDRAPYLLTVSDDGRAHTVAVAPRWDGDELTIAVGRHTVANAQARPAVSLLWPPKDRAGYSLIVDADVTATASTDDGHTVRLRATRAVLHRPAPGLAEGEYDPDCVPVVVD